MWSLCLLLVPLVAGARLRPIPVHPNDVTNSQYVVNGENADNGEWPWQGSLRQGGSHICGCILVDRNWILTAAHCTGSVGYTAVFGSNTLNAGGQTVTITKQVNHPSFVNIGATPNGAFPYDYAVLTPSETVTVGEVVPLTVSDNGSSGKSPCYITGWGRTAGGSPLPNDLKEALIPVISTAECDALWGNSFNPAVHICVLDDNAADSGGLSGACNGDSGGPLVCQDNGVWHLYGITSWVYSGCNTNYPSVYARISTQKAWICANTGNTVGC